jgi:hypothetical protein
MSWKIIASIIIAIACILQAGSAQTIMQSSVLGCGGGTSTASGIKLSATLGQPVIGKSLKEIIAFQGFWYMHRLPSATAVDPVPATLIQNLEIGPGYPNPFALSSMIQLRIKKPGRLVVRMYDVYGRIVRTLIDREEGSGVLPLLVSSSGLESGNYFIHATLDDEPRISSIVVLK